MVASATPSCYLKQENEDIMRSARANLKFIDDLARVATGALGSFSEIRHQVQALVKERVDTLIDQMDVVSREEFERIEAVAEKARRHQIDLEKRIATLEKQLKKSPQKSPKKRKSKK